MRAARCLAGRSRTAPGGHGLGGSFTGALAAQRAAARPPAAPPVHRPRASPSCGALRPSAARFVHLPHASSSCGTVRPPAACVAVRLSKPFTIGLHGRPVPRPVLTCAGRRVPACVLPSRRRSPTAGASGPATAWFGRGACDRSSGGAGRSPSGAVVLRLRQSATGGASRSSGRRRTMAGGAGSNEAAAARRTRRRITVGSGGPCGGGGGGRRPAARAYMRRPWRGTRRPHGARVVWRRRSPES
jgi:hypothetical protein